MRLTTEAVNAFFPCVTSYLGSSRAHVVNTCSGAHSFLLFCLFVLMNTDTRAELGLVWLWKEKKQKEPEDEKRSSSNPQNLNHLAISQTRPKPKSTCKILFLTSYFFQSPQFSGAAV